MDVLRKSISLSNKEIHQSVKKKCLPIWCPARHSDPVSAAAILPTRALQRLPPHNYIPRTVDQSCSDLGQVFKLVNQGKLI